MTTNAHHSLKHPLTRPVAHPPPPCSPTKYQLTDSGNSESVARCSLSLAIQYPVQISTTLARQLHHLSGLAIASSQRTGNCIISVDWQLHHLSGQAIASFQRTANCIISAVQSHPTQVVDAAAKVNTLVQEV